MYYYNAHSQNARTVDCYVYMKLVLFCDADFYVDNCTRETNKLKYKHLHQTPHLVLLLFFFSFWPSEVQFYYFINVATLITCMRGLRSNYFFYITKL